jgi:hypothetical protein
MGWEYNGKVLFTYHHPSIHLAWWFSGCRFTIAGDLQPIEKTKWGKWRTRVRIIVLKGIKDLAHESCTLYNLVGLYGRTPLNVNVWVVHVLETFLTD